MIWIVLGGLAAVAALCLLWPLLRPVRPVGTDPTLALYRRQLDETETLPADEAEAMRLELQRRLLRAADATPPAIANERMSAAMVAGLAVVVLLAAAALYGKIGQPGLPGAPTAGNHPHDATLDPLLAKLQEHLRTHGDDRQGWEMLARGQSLVGRGGDAANAWSRAAALDPKNADLRARIGEALVVAADGLVTPAAELAFRQALALQPDLPAARYYQGLALVQQEKLDQGRAIWADLLASAPADAPWRAQMQRQLAALDARLNVRSMAGSVAQMSAGQQTEFIRGMVARLAARLETEPNDVAGWEKLGQAYAVLGETDQARSAYDRALAQLDKAGPDYARVARAKTALANTAAR